MHKAGYVNIIGSPNMGKSTLMNAWLGEKLAITTAKAQTTRHRILGIYNTDQHQVVFSDTPGILEPAYKLQEKMLEQVFEALKDADILVWVTDLEEQAVRNESILKRVRSLEIPVYVLINKIDLGNQEMLNRCVDFWHEQLPESLIRPVSAIHGFQVQDIFAEILEKLPESPPYFDKEDMSDRPMRFFVSEMIREKIFERLDKEIPYSSEVVVEEYKEEQRLIRIRAEIIVERESQKRIVIGHGGQVIKHIGADARKDIERFVGRQVFLDLHVRVDKDWRSKDNKLKKYGYQ